MQMFRISIESCMWYFLDHDETFAGGSLLHCNRMASEAPYKPHGGSCDFTQ